MLEADSPYLMGCAAGTFRDVLNTLHQLDQEAAVGPDARREPAAAVPEDDRPDAVGGGRRHPPAPLTKSSVNSAAPPLHL